MKACLSLWEVLLLILENRKHSTKSMAPKEDIDHFSEVDLVSIRLIRECKEWAESLLPAAQDLALRYLSHNMQSRLSVEKVSPLRQDPSHNFGDRKSPDTAKKSIRGGDRDSEVNPTTEPKKRRLRSRAEDEVQAEPKLADDSTAPAPPPATVEDELFGDSDYEE
eukprot:Filipodium_phascolosomae@DN3009_c0_g1_i1.p1